MQCLDHQATITRLLLCLKTTSSAMLVLERVQRYKEFIRSKGLLYFEMDIQ